MAHFAKIENNVVTAVIVTMDEDQDIFAERMLQETGETYVQTSYNNNIRKQYAGVGFVYDPIADVFIAPQPYPSWTLDNNFDWQPPVPKPDGLYRWDESTLSWIDIEA